MDLVGALLEKTLASIRSKVRDVSIKRIRLCNRRAWQLPMWWLFFRGKAGVVCVVLLVHKFMLLVFVFHPDHHQITLVNLH